MQLLPGVQRGVEGSSGMHVRGSTPDQNLMILDEATVYNANHLFGFFSVFNADAIRSIELFKGGFPAEFGGRLASVLKINTRNGNKQKFKGKINVGFISSSILLEGPLKKEKTSFIFDARRTYADLLVRPFLNEDTQPISGYFFHDMNFKIHHEFSHKDRIFLSSYVGQDTFFTEDRRTSNKQTQRLAWNNITTNIAMESPIQ